MARRPPSVSDVLFNEMRNATRDVRQKLFEEAWFGRVINVDPVRDHYRPMPESLRPSSFEDVWGKARDADRDADRQDIAHEIDR